LLNLRSQDTEAYFKRGIIRATLADYSQAIADFTEVIKLDSQSTLAYVNRGIAYSNLGESQKALTDLQQAGNILKQQNDTAAYQEIQQLINKIRSQTAKSRIS
ncbi:MAG: tetratricopeptide repeat protein, partial [Xenococcaceae cyanobacterium]